MPKTALRHFQADILLATALIDHAETLPWTAPNERLIRADILRSAWMFAVGALDAYFCDAYADVIAATTSSKSRQAAIVLPKWVYDIKLPLQAVLEEYSYSNWRWRMAARKMMERENVLSLSAIQTLFNKFFRVERRFFRGLLDEWMTRPDSNMRLFGIRPLDYAACSEVGKRRAREEAIEVFEERFEDIFQRRHDCIHNCDRPRVSPQPLNKCDTVRMVIHDVQFLVNRCDEHIAAEFREFLAGVGCTPATIALAGY